MSDPTLCKLRSHTATALYLTDALFLFVTH